MANARDTKAKLFFSQLEHLRITYHSAENDQEAVHCINNLISLNIRCDFQRTPKEEARFEKILAELLIPRNKERLPIAFRLKKLKELEEIVNRKSKVYRQLKPYISKGEQLARLENLISTIDRYFARFLPDANKLSSKEKKIKHEIDKLKKEPAMIEVNRFREIGLIPTAYYSWSALHYNLQLRANDTLTSKPSIQAALKRLLAQVKDKNISAANREISLRSTDLLLSGRMSYKQYTQLTKEVFGPSPKSLTITYFRNLFASACINYFLTIVLIVSLAALISTFNPIGFAIMSAYSTYHIPLIALLTGLLLKDNRTLESRFENPGLHMLELSKQIKRSYAFFNSEDLPPYTESSDLPPAYAETETQREPLADPLRLSYV